MKETHLESEIEEFLIDFAEHHDENTVFAFRHFLVTLKRNDFRLVRGDIPPVSASPHDTKQLRITFQHQDVAHFCAKLYPAAGAASI